MATFIAPNEVDATGTTVAADAACLSGIRAAVADGAARIVGKTNLDELATAGAPLK